MSLSVGLWCLLQPLSRALELLFVQVLAIRPCLSGSLCQRDLFRRCCLLCSVEEVVLEHGDLAVNSLDFSLQVSCVLLDVLSSRVLIHVLLCEVELRGWSMLALIQDLTSRK